MDPKLRLQKKKRVLFVLPKRPCKAKIKKKLLIQITDLGTCRQSRTECGYKYNVLRTDVTSVSFTFSTCIIYLILEYNILEPS
jgi:hypothetical protein